MPRKKLGALLQRKPVEQPRPDYSDGRGFDPTDPRDGFPRMILTWVTNGEGESGFSVDTMNLAPDATLRFYTDAASTVAEHAMAMQAGAKGGGR